MSEPWPDALFGVDGTELPAPSDRSRRPDRAVPPPFVLPPIPNLGMTREAVAAALGDEPARPADQEPVAKPAASPSATPAPPQPSPAQPNATAPLPAAPAQPPPGPPPAGAPGYNQRPVIAAPVPAQSSRYRPPPVPGSRPPGISGNIRRRVATQTRSNGGAGAFFIVISVVFVVLLYFIISGIVEAFVRLIP